MKAFSVNLLFLDYFFDIISIKIIFMLFTRVKDFIFHTIIFFR